jgi:hypothetical protein
MYRFELIWVNMVNQAAKIMTPAIQKCTTFTKEMKAIIPVAGAGTKLRPHTYTQPKALIPLAGKTILSIIVDQ